MNETYKRIREKSKKHGETNDCTVKAVAILSNSEYEDAHNLLASRGRKPGKGFSLIGTIDALRELGCWVGPGYRPQARTVRTLERSLPKSGRFLVSVHGHVLAAVDGEVIDWTKGRLHRIRRIYEVGL